MTPPPSFLATTKPIHRLGRWLLTIIVLITFIALGLTIWLIVEEKQWAKPILEESPAKVFAQGTIGTEAFPLPVFQVLPSLFPEYFQPFGPQMGDWIDQFGFIRNPDDPNGLPVGLTTRPYRPGTAAPSPTPFVGFACSACHSLELKIDANGPREVIYGAGNYSLNLLAFGEAYRGALMTKDESGEYRLNSKTITQEYQQKLGKELSQVDQTMISLWLGVARSTELEFEKQVDEPFTPKQIMLPEFVPAGPVRTQPFRSLVRIIKERPGSWMLAPTPDRGFSKIPAVFHQAHEYHGQWAQFDGSIANLNARSSLAAMTAGATVHNLAHPEIAHNIQQAAIYTKTAHGKSWEQIAFLPKIESEKAKRGEKVYREHCFRCHGGPDPNNPSGWLVGEPGSFGRNHEIGTDRHRLEFRHRDQMADILFNTFDRYRKDHPLRFPRDEIRVPNLNDPQENGYYAGPISRVFLRAPYLHNGSIPTLEELILIKPRRNEPYYRGRELFDPQAIGIRVEKNPTATHYFKFDPKLPGNSDQGHEFPWKIDDPKRDQNQLLDLLEYLKTL
jgi:hypothetical protein